MFILTQHFLVILKVFFFFFVISPVVQCVRLFNLYLFSNGDILKFCKVIILFVWSVMTCPNVLYSNFRSKPGFYQIIFISTIHLLLYQFFSSLHRSILHTDIQTPPLFYNSRSNVIGVNMSFTVGVRNYLITSFIVKVNLTFNNQDKFKVDWITG